MTSPCGMDDCLRSHPLPWKVAAAGKLYGISIGEEVIDAEGYVVETFASKEAARAYVAAHLPAEAQAKGEGR